jgi:hypothetical protein
MKTQTQSKPNRSNQPFQHAMIAKKIEPYNGAPIKALFEVTETTDPMYPGILDNKIRIVDASDNVKSAMRNSVEFTITSGIFPNFSFESALFIDEELPNFYYGRNIRAGKNPSDFFVFEYCPDEEEIILLVARETTWDQWNTFIWPDFKSGRLNDEIRELTSKMQRITSDTL